ncbi:MAG: Pr6Pr family membrane protein [Gulosibacter sp.]|uniref:Pr6Pr family membrane protein n=1 Tax=Gulosibacter sp. TaxID=2817531 RepID=UPI003F8DAB8A
MPAINRNQATNRRLHPDRAWLRILRFLLGAITVVAVIRNFYRSANGLTDNTLVQSLSQFTNQACLVFGLCLVIGAVISRDRLPGWWDHLRGGLAFYMVMTGLIYALLVAEPGEMARWDLEWTNLALHRLAPVAGLIEWMLVTMTTRGSWGRPLAWLIYPVAYLVYTWIRGAIVQWYPYGFLDPTQDGGWGEVLQTTGMVLAAFLAISLLVHILGNLRVAIARKA